MECGVSVFPARRGQGEPASNRGSGRSWKQLLLRAALAPSQRIKKSVAFTGSERPRGGPFLRLRFAEARSAASQPEPVFYVIHRGAHRLAERKQPLGKRRRLNKSARVRRPRGHAAASPSL